MNLTQDEIARFKKKFTEGQHDECWEWQGAKYQSGYGVVGIRRPGRKSWLAHRIAWMVHTQADIPQRLMICHKCANKLCVNPNHLYAGTGYDNNKDTIKHGRGNRKVGDQCSWAKISEKDVCAILTSTEKQCVLAIKYGVSQSMISTIKSGKRRQQVSRLTA